MRSRLLVLTLLASACGPGGPGPDGGPGFQVPDLTKSTLTADPSMEIVAGTGQARLIATVRDADDQPVSNVQVDFQVSGSMNQFNDRSITDQQGVATMTLQSNKAETKTVTASLNLDGVQSPLSQSVSVIIVAGPPVNVTFKTQPTTTKAGLAITPAVELQMVDAHGNPSSSSAGSALVRLVRSTGGTVSNGGVKTAVDGIVRFDNLVINRPQVGYALRAEATGGGADESVLFDVTLGDLSQATSTFTPMPANVIADGASTSVLTLTARDTGGNVLANQAVSLSVSGTGHTLGATSGMTDIAGVFSTTLSATTTGARTVTATVGTATLMTTVTFIP